MVYALIVQQVDLNRLYPSMIQVCVSSVHPAHIHRQVNPIVCHVTPELTKKLQVLVVANSVRLVKFLPRALQTAPLHVPIIHILLMDNAHFVRLVKQPLSCAQRMKQHVFHVRSD